jgi:hypothetical protein
MELLLAGLGMLVCLAMMLVVVPLGIRVVRRRIRRVPTNHAPDSTTSVLHDAPRPPMLRRAAAAGEVLKVSPLLPGGRRRSGAEVAEAEGADVLVVGGGRAGLAASYDRRGVTRGLYFLGMDNRYSRGSSLIGFVRQDAAFVVDRIVDRINGQRKRPTGPIPTGPNGPGRS